LLVFANKQDIAGAMTADEIRDVSVFLARVGILN
jgi:signal recognition particle receptor subunit beta